MLTAAQIKAARALVDWSQPQLAEASGLSMPTIRRMEGPLGPGRSSAANVEAVKQALEGAGVTFMDAGELKSGGPGVRFRD